GSLLGPPIGLILFLILPNGRSLTVAQRARQVTVPLGVQFYTRLKARTRLATTPTESVYLFRSRRECAQFARACAAFNSEPWVAVYFEREGDTELYLTSLDNYARRYWLRGAPIDSW